jgi:hypothetical protein
LWRESRFGSLHEETILPSAIYCSHGLRLILRYAFALLDHTHSPHSREKMLSRIAAAGSNMRSRCCQLPKGGARTQQALALRQQRPHINHSSYSSPSSFSRTFVSRTTPQCMPIQVVQVRQKFIQSRHTTTTCTFTRPTGQCSSSTEYQVILHLLDRTFYLTLYRPPLLPLRDEQISLTICKAIIPGTSSTTGSAPHPTQPNQVNVWTCTRTHTQLTN